MGTSDLAAAAAKNCLEKRGIPATEVEAILVATVIGSGIMAERSAAGASMITRLL